MILVCGSLADIVTELVCARLQSRGRAYRLFDPAAGPATGGGPVSLHAEWEAGALRDGWIAASGWRVAFAELTGVFIRFGGAPSQSEPPQGLSQVDAEAIHRESVAALTAVVEQLPCRVVNRMLGGMSNNSKAYQALCIRDCGLLVPDTLVTDDADAARAFAAEHKGDVIFKSLSGVRSIVRRLDAAQDARLAHLRHGPAQLQARVPGADVRVHVVGDRLFATRVETEAVDYRYAGRQGLDVAMIPHDLPAPVAESCLRLARRLDLELAGIDLRVRPDGEYVCFEANPSPAFSYYEQATGQPISAAVADLLFGSATAADGEH